MKMRCLLHSTSMIMDILRSVVISSLEGIKLYHSIVEFVIGCMFMTKAAHGGDPDVKPPQSSCSVFGWA